ncbi:hypothetical protein F5X97DRAFT_119528 [Nemania serpens]|nr:hypothetical protein F5X97DRAFT_119528 [Nemania serpens]
MGDLTDSRSPLPPAPINALFALFLFHHTLSFPRLEPGQQRLSNSKYLPAHPPPLVLVAPINNNSNNNNIRRSYKQTSRTASSFHFWIVADLRVHPHPLLSSLRVRNQISHRHRHRHLPIYQSTSLPVYQYPTMADYVSLKVPELKKLLQEKQLPVTGNKADLIARLQEHDKPKEEPKPATAAAPVSAEEDPIDYSDDDVPASNPVPAAEPAVEEKPTAAATEPAPEAPAPSSADKPAETTTDDAEPAEPEEEAAPKTDFSAHLPASTVDDEARKRAERAKRFGVVEEQDEDGKKKADRAKRFGADQSGLVSGLDSALPEKRERKRGREGAPNANADGERGPKRLQQHNGPARRRGGRDTRSRGGRQGGSDRGPPRKEGGGGSGNSARPRRVVDDPSERAKAEARAKRFGGGA